MFGNNVGGCLELTVGGCLEHQRWLFGTTNVHSKQRWWLFGKTTVVNWNGRWWFQQPRWWLFGIVIGCLETTNQRLFGNHNDNCLELSLVVVWNCRSWLFGMDVGGCLEFQTTTNVVGGCLEPTLVVVWN